MSESPARRFSDRAEAYAEATRINNKPRSGIARIQFVGAYNAWVVEVNPRRNRFGNPAVLRENGTLVKYHP